MSHNKGTIKKCLEYGLDDKGTDFTFRHRFQTSSGAYRNSYAMDMADLIVVESTRIWPYTYIYCRN